MKISNYFNFFLFSSGIFLLVLTFGCVNPPEYPIVPNIQFVSMTKDTMPRGFASDSTLITLSFTDGDGDIGRKDTVSDIFIIDGRDSNVTRGRIPFVPELGASNGIKGEISVVIDNSCCIFPNPLYDGCSETFPGYPYDPVTFSIYIMDRKGNQSNTVVLPPIYMRCFE
ncbi:MAG: hypothetical protein GC192_16775 [Bacteroidetes bacterium]|nr:hypothetical protein [Bacteroidota bacterium]